MKLLAILILYHPDEKDIQNMNALLDCKEVDYVTIFDNSEESNEHLISTTREKKMYSYIPYMENKGIAKALKDGMNYAMENKYDFTLTLDQDSIFPFFQMEEIKKKLESRKEYGIVSLNYNHRYNETSEEIRVKTIITSGNFINVDQYRRIEGFHEELFIDYVDFDLDHQFYKKGIPLLLLTRYNLIQSVGTPVTRRFLFLTLTSKSHSPIRCYYRYRNEAYLYKKDKRFYRIQHFKEKAAHFLICYVEKDHKAKNKMIKSGKKDAKVGRLGKYHG